MRGLYVFVRSSITFLHAAEDLQQRKATTACSPNNVKTVTVVIFESVPVHLKLWQQLKQCQEPVIRFNLESQWGQLVTQSIRQN